MGIGLQETARVDGGAADTDFEMQMGAGRAAGRSHAADQIAALQDAYERATMQDVAR